MLTAYKDFRNRLKKEIWPSTAGEERSLVDIHNRMFVEAMNDLGKWVRCLQQRHTDVHPFLSTLMHCGTSIVCAPKGMIQKVYTITNDIWCDTVVYERWSKHELDCWVKDLLLNWTEPPNTGLPKLNEGYKYPEDDTDIVGGRAMLGAYAFENERLHVAPWLQSNEKLVVEWTGYKREWNVEDMVDETVWDVEVTNAIKLYVQWKHELQFGCDRARRSDLKAELNEARANAIHSCESRIRNRRNEECLTVARGPSSDEVKDNDDPVPVTVKNASNTWAQIADFGKPTHTIVIGGENVVPEKLVADMVKSWNPQFIVSAGDQIYEPTNKYADAVGAFYGDFVNSDDDAKNKFWAAISNHDISATADSLASYYAYFSPIHKRRYYDHIQSPVHFFVLNSDPFEPDGRSSNSDQAIWLKARLMLSTARWKVVVLHDPPYTEETSDFPGHTILRWPYKAWGADLVLSGDNHAYNRYEVDGLPYIVNGAGGAELSSQEATPNANDAIRLAVHLKHGALRCSATCTQLKCEFLNAEDPSYPVLDTLILTKAA